MAEDQQKTLSRRHAVFAGLSAVVLGGCASRNGRASGGRPTPPWPGYPAGPSANRGHVTVHPTHRSTPPTQQPGSIGSTTGITAIGRSQWTRTGPKRSDANPMKGISKITIHHEGWKAVWFSDKKTTAERIELIRKVHTRDRGWADIGYHYVIDRGGRVWEARPVSYQGAHVKNNNPNNVGILVLGNFEKQSPSDAQLKALFKTAAQLKQRYRVKPGLVRSHQEINPTTCPGRNLQNRMDALRRHVA